MEILVPISIGELYDKITILEIKMDHIKDPEKIINVMKELHLLKGIFDKLDTKYFEKLEKLKDVNKKLWNVEDKLRIMERNKECIPGPKKPPIRDIPNSWKFPLNKNLEKFINLARQVYYCNDERAKIKREINILYDSYIIEEKSYEKY
jgi:hypothetical protein